ncbi:hypothetical protein MAPG_06745 [Magnaporthiopsis poae ATCC 64411]|uniref:Chromatin modification-related protein n=1 Tax=Magnaporthiopsis poae (strain ATCC 64411 / 73-15) TaxID=644358 RepID=A0A0C4E2V4_MAGP6|nr:hypothetical protein MAPG_06745 [Magnaporthiopsis poae ATCC 64411]
MPRDDLSIDFVKKMPQGEALDPSMILDDWTHRVQNLPEEIRFIQDEIADKDKQYYECIKIIEDRDARIQKFIKAHGSHEKNVREESLRGVIRENFAKADALAAEKIALTERMTMIMDKHLRQLDMQIKMLYDRNEPGFTDPDELPSLLRPTASQPPPPSRITLTVNTNIASVSTQIHTSTAATPSTVRIASGSARGVHATSASAPATPAASMILGRQAREMSAGPGSGVPKRGPRVNSGLGNAPATSSSLARHSSLGPGTPKGHQTATGAQRAGSAGPRASIKGTAAGGTGRKSGTPSSSHSRKKSTPAATTAGVNKSGLSRVKRVSAKASPSSTVDSDLSDAASHQSGDDRSSRTGTPAAPPGSASQQNKGAMGVAGRPGSGVARLKKEHRGSADENDDDEEMLDIEDDEAGDDRKYCICQNVSFGDMVACDNPECPTEWFHWGCVGLKAEPTGLWYCPICDETMKKNGNKGK